MSRVDETAARRLLERHLPDFAWHQEASEVDLVGTRPHGRRVLVEVKALSTLRHRDLVGRLSTAILQLRAHATPGEITVALVAIPAITPAALNAVRRFLSEVAPEQAWGLLADDGSTVLEIPSLGVRVHERGTRRTESHAEPRQRRLFSDLNQWMLKVLLLRATEARLWGGPRRPIERARDLAVAAEVSTPHAYRFIKLFEEDDFLRAGEEGLRIVRRSALFREWSLATRRQAGRAIPVRWAFGRPGSLAEIVGQGPDAPLYAIGAFEACRAFGALHTTAPIPEIYVEGPRAEILRRWALEETHERDAHVSLRITSSQAIFRGRVVIDGLSYVDVLQAALDVSRHPARGEEQASYLLDHVLGWSE